jgi:DNA-binding NtrC family response regulator
MSRGTPRSPSIEVSAASATPDAPVDHSLGGLIGHSEEMQQLFRLIRRVAPLGLSVVIQGETGTGKELAARAIHDLGPRRMQPFVVVDCGGIAPNLIESELFGHEKGSFTGASTSRIGAFERAHHGTLFLDELGELPLDLQPKLLRVLESREVWRVGGNEVIAFDVRVVAATNRDLTSAIARGVFREDLFYRLAVINLSLPPLRRRRDDIPHLLQHLLQRDHPRLERAPRRLAEEARRILLEYPWPGNVRELRNVVSHLVTFSEEEEIRAEHLPSWLKEQTSPIPAVRFDEHLTFKDAKDQLLAAFERNYIERTLQRSGGNISKAARASGLHRKSIERLIKKYDLHPREAKPRG